ncbi:MAG: hypothetical protein U1E65_33895 [Myxococcota bacterium]
MLVLVGFLGALVWGQAADFDAVTGKVQLDPREFQRGFDGPVNGVFVSGKTTYVTDPAALEGTGFLRVAATDPFVAIDFHPSDLHGLIGRRVEVLYWQRPEGLLVQSTLFWSIPQPLAGSLLAGSLAFQPSGRRTDDGWEEWTTGPVDLALGGVFTPGTLSFQAEADLDDPGANTSLDAFHIRDLGPALVSKQSCSLVSEDERCGPAGLCLLGRCTDAAPLLGARVEDPELRRAYLERFAQQFFAFEGGVAPQAKWERFHAALNALADAPTAKAFRQGLSAAVSTLGDGHARPPQRGFGILSASSSVCMDLGSADLLPGAPELPLITVIDRSATWARDLRVGDALVEIDGLAVDDWRALAKSRLDYHGDEAGRSFATTGQLLAAAVSSGARLKLRRCPSAASGACAPSELVEFEVDFSAIEAALWSSLAVPWDLEGRTFCDHRFQAINRDRRDDYYYAASALRDGVQYIGVNGTPSIGPRSSDRAIRWRAQVSEALSGTSTRVVFDQRLGLGGTDSGIDLIVSSVLPPALLTEVIDVPRLFVPIEVAASSLPICESDPAPICEDYNAWEVGVPSGLGSGRGGGAGARIAVLDGFDVSGNDYVARAFALRPNTRIFGPVPTVGAYGFVLGLPPVLGDWDGGSIQGSDAVFLGQRGDPWEGRATGTGVAPHEVVLQKQSDLLRGVDTALDAAERWVRGEDR